jgi:hypothetical protein
LEMHMSGYRLLMNGKFQIRKSIASGITAHTYAAQSQ